MVQTFIRKPLPVRAVRWTGDNVEEIRAFVNTDPEPIDQIREPHLVIGDYCLEYGDWIVKDDKGTYKLYDHDRFIEVFESVQSSINRQLDTSTIIDALNNVQEGYKVCTDELKTLLGVVSPSEHCESTITTCRPEYEHLVDVTTPSDYERTGGVYIYRLAPGCEFKDLSSSEWTAYKDGCVFDKSAERQYPAHTLKRYYINYGFGVAQLVTPYEPEERFYTLANTCFGIRKSIMMCSIIKAVAVDKRDYERLSFNADEYIWRKDGARKMISPELDEKWNLNFCEDCIYRGDPRV